MIAEATEDWSYLKFPFYRAAGYPEGSYRVGPLARLNVCDSAGMPEAQLHQAFSYGDPTAYAAVVVEGRLLVRTGQHLYSVAESSGDDAAGP